MALIDDEAIDNKADTTTLRDALRPNGAVLLVGTVAVALLSATTLPWPDAIASTVLGALMIAGADVDARNFLLPNTVTGGAVLCGLAAAAALEPFDPWLGFTTAAGGALVVGAALWLVRWIHARIRGREGIGLGDVKLAAAIGAWLPLDAVPVCLTLATGAALIAVLAARWRGETVERTARVPFGAFLCPALWLVDYATRLQSG
ncbi:A24 family peptidase [Bradyrhizobium prioriisuperbiae]|uniref:prepilin peptidase n=1 Tax=Bradyrhizobium prioriisuperbiae TaxID=2854389 RepID=UPI0028E53422|nr:A24 family peptidase [Bradyrhizobium prioritasuperba]